MNHFLPPHHIDAFDREIVRTLLIAGGSATEHAIREMTEHRSPATSTFFLAAALETLHAHGLVTVENEKQPAVYTLTSAMTQAMGKEVAAETYAAFAPFEDLARALLPYTADCSDAAHDTSHLIRVWNNAKTILATEGGDPRIVAAAVMTHDAVNVEKNSPLRSSASRMSGHVAVTLLLAEGWSFEDADEVRHAVEAHSHSAGITPMTLEAQIVQDADRLDAIGAIGIARCFHVAGRIRRDLYDHADPTGKNRALDDIAYTLDHFDVKLFGVADGMNTGTGRTMAEGRNDRMARFHTDFLAEIVGEA